MNIRAHYEKIRIAERGHSHNPIRETLYRIKVLVAGVPRRDFEELWRGLYPEGLKSWGMAPWVWVIDFEVVK